MVEDGFGARRKMPRENARSIVRLLWAIAIWFCLGLLITREAAFARCGLPAQVQESTPPQTNQEKPAPTKDNPSNPSTTQKADPNTEPKTDTQIDMQQTEPKKTPGVENEPKTDPNAVPTSEPKMEPKGDSPGESPSNGVNVEAKPAAVKPDANAAGANARPHAFRRRSVPSANGKPRKVVVREGGTEEPATQIVTGMAPDEAYRKRQKAEQLLKSTDELLQLTAPSATDPQSQETVSQIHNYIEGARAALKAGDIARGHTLAVKADLLAEDLAKH
jgi:hypothetical protein